MTSVVFFFCFTGVLAAAVAAWLKLSSTKDKVACLDARIPSVVRENESLKSAIKARAEGLGDDSLSGVATYFRALQRDIAHQIQLLQESTQHLPFDQIDEQIDLTRVVDRKRRFAAYRDALSKANLNVPAAV